MSPLHGARVAVVNWRDLDHSLAGGSERYAWEFALALRNAGASVDFVTARERGQSSREVVDGITVRRGGGPFTFYAWAAWYYLTRRRRLDAVVDAECGIPSFAPLFVRRRTAVVMVVHHVHLAQFATYFPAPLARLGQFLEGTLMPRVYRRTRTVAVSDSTRREMHEQLGWTRPVEILANGSTLPDDRDVAVEDKEPGSVVVLGRLVPHKRVDLVIRAFARVAATRPEARLDIVGKGPEQGALTELVDQLGLRDRATVHGYLSEEDKGRLLRRASLHVCASDVEGWGQVVIEAAGYGVPTIARDVPGLRDSIRHEQTGWLTDDPAVDSADRLAEVEQRLVFEIDAALTRLDEPEIRVQMFEHCRAWASEFSWQRMHHEASSLIEAELGGAPLPFPARDVTPEPRRANDSLAV
jgi:glycosyltransferase involved in cell wall biosynthesis